MATTETTKYLLTLPVDWLAALQAKAPENVAHYVRELIRESLEDEYELSEITPRGKHER